jgi:hypothetical protein
LLKSTKVKISAHPDEECVVEDFGLAEDGGVGDAFMGRVMVPLSEVATIAHKYCTNRHNRT